MAALAQRCQVIATAPEAQPARIVSINSLDKLDAAALAVRASPETAWQRCASAAMPRARCCS